MGKREDQAVALLCSVLAVKLWQHNHVLGERVDSWAIPTGLVREGSAVHKEVKEWLGDVSTNVRK